MNRLQAIDKIRDFNRTYTSIISVLDSNVLQSGFSLAEARILYEIKINQPCSARRIMDILSMDEGYLSRLINKLVAAHYVQREKSNTDKRLYNLSLTPEGIAKMKYLDSLANESMNKLIEKLEDNQVLQLIEHMENIKSLLK